MNDRSATVSSTGPPMSSGTSARTLVRSCTRTRVVRPQPPHELPVSDVDRDDLGGAAVEQDVGEPAGGGARVEAARDPRRTTSPKASSAPISLCAPRDAHSPLVRLAAR